MNETFTRTQTRSKRPTRTLHTSVSISIPRAIREVFDYLSALEHNPAWNWSVSATTSLTPGPRRPGSRYLQASAGEPNRPQTLEVIRVVPPRILEVKSIGSSMSATYLYELHPGDGAGTDVTVHAAVSPRHAVGLPHLYLQRLEASLRGNLDNLCSVIIAAPPEGALSRQGTGETDE